MTKHSQNSVSHIWRVDISIETISIGLEGQILISPQSQLPGILVEILVPHDYILVLNQ